MLFSSIKGINRVTSKGMSNICLKVTILQKLTSSKLQFSKFKKVVSSSVLGDLRLTQISLNLKTRGLEGKMLVVFLLF